MVSIIIPAREEKYLEKTIRNILENATGEIEIIAILDGYIPDPQINLNDDRVIFVHNEVAIGQRPAINQGAKMAKGNYIMKLDAHCAVGKGFDEILVRDCEYDMTMIPQMYNLDVATWTPKLIDNYREAVRQGKVNPYMFIGKDNGRLRTLYYNKTEKKQLDLGRQNIMIDEVMSCMGCCFFMHKDRYWELGGCDEGHGHWGQQGVEVACKAWLSGGRLMVNKNTWFAHFFRGGGVPDGEQRGAPWPGFTQEMVDKARDYSEDLWLKDKWPQAKHKFEWLLEKFNPPTWVKPMILELGSGRMKRVPDVINVDIRPLPNVDVVCDLRKLPYEDNTIDEIRSSDVIEHFGRFEIEPLLKEWVRVLKPGGVMLNRTVDIGRNMDKWHEIPWPDLMNAVLGAQDYEQNFHKMMFTKESLSELMTKAGMKILKTERYSIRKLPRMRVIGQKI